MTETKFGIENFTKVLDLAIELGNAGGKAYEDGKLEVSDFAHLLILFDEITALGSVDFSVIPKEIGDFDSVEVVQIGDHLKQKFDIPQDQVEGIIEDGIALVVKLIDDGFAIGAYVKKIQAFKTA